MANKKKQPPAFQYYPDEFEQGTATYTLAQVGAYQRLLNYQWPNGSVPGEDIEALSRILRVSVDEARSIWSVISEKFRVRKGLFQNVRMEKERRKQRAFAKKQAENGRKGGRPRKNPGLLSGFHLAKPKHKAKKSSPSPSPSPDQVQTPQPPSLRGARITRRELQHARQVRQSLGRCFHEPVCASYQACLELLAFEARTRKETA